MGEGHAFPIEEVLGVNSASGTVSYQKDQVNVDDLYNSINVENRNSDVRWAAT